MSIERIVFAGEPYEWNTSNVLGRGRYGTVFLGVAPDGSDVAVKVIPIRSDSTERWYGDSRLAERELELLRRINAEHPNLLPILAWSSTKDGLVLVMPRAERSLAEDLVDGPMQESAAREVLLDGAHGLQQLARLPAVHRDISPGNIFRWRARWVLGDFGVARILEESTSTYTWSMTGTHAYWAPELFRSDPATPQSDMYALACVTLEALNGTKPFANDEGLARAHSLLDPPIPELSDTGFRRSLIEMLVKDPTGRPSDARRVVDLLTRDSSTSKGRVGLRALSLAASSRRLTLSRLDAERREIEERRDTARGILERLWNELVEEARQEEEDVKSFTTADELVLDYADSRLKIQIITPPSDNDTLLYGRVTVVAQPNAEPTYPVNIICTWTSGRPLWEIARFSPNGLSVRPDPGGGPSRTANRGALGLGHLVETWPKVGSPVPPVFTERFEMTVENLLQEFAAEVQAGSGWT